MSRAFKHAVLLVLALVPVPAAAGRRPHEEMSTGGNTQCRVCHPNYPRDPRWPGWVSIDVPAGGKTALADPGARICWVCHRAGNTYGAPAEEDRAFATDAHRINADPVYTPDSWAARKPVREPSPRGTLPGTGTGTVSCRSCHDSHAAGVPRLLKTSTADGDATPLCRGCHPGRDNPGLLGRDNISARERIAYSTHPTGIDAPALPERAAPRPGGPRARAPITCVTCHDAHRAPQPGEVAAVDLLRVPRGGAVDDLCRSCHADTAGGEGHPLRGGAGRRYPPSFASNDGIPPAWTPSRHFDAGATWISTARREAPACTSCHDIHGGLPMTGLLFGPAGAGDGDSDWCASCHALEPLARAGHGDRVAAPPLAACESCHGPGDGLARWGGHRGFRAVANAPRAAAVELPAEEDLVSRLGRALLDGRRAVRDHAGDALARLRSPLATPIAVAALADDRADVRESAVRILGFDASADSGALLVALFDNADPGLRAAAARALGAAADPGATPALITLLGDPSRDVRESAVVALARRRDPRAIDSLVVVVLGSDVELRIQALDALIKTNNARALELFLDAPGDHIYELIRILNTINDPDALPLLGRALRHEQRLVRHAAADSLRRYRYPEAVEALLGALEERDPLIWRTIVASLASHREPRAVPGIVAVLADPRETKANRRAGAAALGQIPSAAAVPPLIDALGDPSPELRVLANAGLEALTCRNFGEDQGQWRAWWERQDPTFPVGRCR